MSANVIMPALGMAHETGKVLRWLKREGDPVSRGEPLLEIETDKATVELEAPATGVLVSVTAAEGDTVPVGQVIAQILAEGASGTSPPVVSSPIAEAAPAPTSPTVPGVVMSPANPSRPSRWIGAPLRGLEDERFLRGQARYVGDIVLPNMLHMMVVRSPLAHARVQKINAGQVLRARGVVTVVTSSDVTGKVRPMPVASTEGAQVAQIPHPLLATDKVRYVGEPVAVILAESHAAAADALDLLEVEYDPLPAVVDPHESLKGTVRLHESLQDNVFSRWSRNGGDVEGAFAQAHRVVRGTFHIPRLAPAPIEPRGAVFCLPTDPLLTFP